MYKIGNLILTIEEYGSKKLVVREVNGANVIAQTTNGKKKYHLKTSQIKTVLQDIVEIIEVAPQSDAKFYCEQQGKKFPHEKSYWEFLAKLVPGDKIKVSHQRFVYDAVFLQINQEKPVYPFQAKIKNRICNFKLNALILQT
jgi:hypothetical protein